MDEGGWREPKFGAEEVGLDPWGTREPREVYELECDLSSKIFEELT